MEGVIHHYSISTIRFFNSSTLQLATMAAATTHWTHKKLVRTVATDEMTVIPWLQTRHLLAQGMNCSKCGSRCRMVQRRGSYSWRCPSKGCQTFTSVRNNSFFSRSHLKLEFLMSGGHTAASLLSSHTNSVEGYWSCAKWQMSRQGMNTSKVSGWKTHTLTLP